MSTGIVRCSNAQCLRAWSKLGRLDAAVSAPILIKKYGNRRLYDTGESRYITLDELSKKVQEGHDVQVMDAKSGADLTQATLTQIIIEGRGVVRMLPVPLLMRLIRLGDDALAEFFGRYVSDALELYLQMKRGASAVARYNPFAAMPFAATDTIARLWMGSPFGTSRAGEPWQPPSTSSAQEPDGSGDDMLEPSFAGNNANSHGEELAELRKELEALKRSMQRESEPSPRRATRKRSKPR